MGLYARRFWLEENSPALSRAERRATRTILARQRPDGSFGGLAPTIQNLYALHLLRRERSLELDRALDWLWETGQASLAASRRPDGAIYHDLLFRMRPGEASRLNSASAFPFTKGCSGFVKTAAGIFLASIFGRGREARVLRALQCFSEIAEVRGGLWCARGCSANVLRAYMVHPDASRGRSLGSAVRKLRRLQAGPGSWPGMPFAGIFNGLAHLDTRDARVQVRRALPLVQRIQNQDGTWGRSPTREQTSFLIVDAIRRMEA